MCNNNNNINNINNNNINMFNNNEIMILLM